MCLGIDIICLGLCCQLVLGTVVMCAFVDLSVESFLSPYLIPSHISDSLPGLTGILNESFVVSNSADEIRCDITIIFLRKCHHNGCCNNDNLVAAITARIYAWFL